MDATSAIVAVLFVVTILSSLGGNKNSSPTPPSRTQVPIVQPAVPPQPLKYSGGSIGVQFSSVDGNASRVSISRFIQKYRSQIEAEAITDSILRHAQTYDVNPKLVAALIARESRFNPRAVSSSGALGLGQLLPSTCKGLGVTDGFDIDQNAKGTVRYFKYLLDKFKKYGEQVSFAIAGYLEGPNAVERNRTYSSHTQTYIDDIIKYYGKL